jgi:hypothetical protein
MIRGPPVVPRWYKLSVTVEYIVALSCVKGNTLVDVIVPVRPYPAALYLINPYILIYSRGDVTERLAFNELMRRIFVKLGEQRRWTPSSDASVKLIGAGSWKLLYRVAVNTVCSCEDVIQARERLQVHRNASVNTACRL